MPPPRSVRVALPGGRAYAVHFDALAGLPRHLARAGLRPGPCLVVTDAHVAAHYLAPVQAALTGSGWTPHALALPPGEATKSLVRFEEVIDWALGLGIERGTPLLALGGGVVGDLAGFAAATLLRGLPLVQLPTSLLAQVDSAVGGKTGVNHPRGKNLVGALYQPRLVLADPATLATLPAREYTSALAEVVKHALLAGPRAVGWLEANWAPLLARDPDVTGRMVRRAVALKAAVVAEDEAEHGRRALLNLGHTFGHAVENAAGYGTFTHGEAVALGLRAALHLSASLAAGRPLPPGASLPEPFGRADRLVARLPLPASLAGLPQATLDRAMGTDKKRAAGSVRFVVLDGPGRARVTADVPPAFVAAAWAHLRSVSAGRYGIRPGTSADVPALPEIERRSATRFDGTASCGGITLANPDETVPPESLEAGAREGRLWVAEDGAGRLVGFALASTVGGEGYLEEVDVLPEHGQRGVGTALVEAACAWARAAGYAALTLTTFRRVPWNAPFYARLGFRPLAAAETPPALQERLRDEAARGLARKTRVAMRRALGDP